MQNKCYVKGIEEIYFFHFVGLLFLLAQIILNPSIAKADVSSPPPLIMYF